MKYLIASLCLLVATSNASATTVDVQNGVVPVKLRPYLQKLVGEYSAHYNSLPIHKAGNTTLRYNPTGQLDFTSDFDLVGNNCLSRVNELVSVQYSDNEGSVDLTAPVGAWFYINGGSCQIDGKYLHLSFNRTIFGKDHFRADLLVRKGFHNSRGLLVNRVERQWVLSKPTD